VDELNAPVSVLIELVASEYAPQFANIATAIAAIAKYGDLILIPTPERRRLSRARSVGPGHYLLAG
jgi:hypothetical protein